MLMMIKEARFTLKCQFNTDLIDALTFWPWYLDEKVLLAKENKRDADEFYFVGLFSWKLSGNTEEISSEQQLL